ncbi:helix-turn-helix domain-containing protein [Devosia sp. A369]
MLRFLRESQGNRTKASKVLGISIRTLRNKLRQFRSEMSADKHSMVYVSVRDHTDGSRVACSDRLHRPKTCGNKRQSSSQPQIVALSYPDTTI